MTRFLFDSDVVIWYLKGREKETKLLHEFSPKGDLAISVVTITEVRVGLKKQPEKIIKQLQEIFKPLPLDAKTAELAGAYKQKYNFDIADMFIAATAVLSDSILVTYNQKHFPMKEIKLYT